LKSIRGLKLAKRFRFHGGAKLDAELEAARKAGDVPRMQMSLAALIALFNSMHRRRSST
jgi:hypothetical protein